MPGTTTRWFIREDGLRLRIVPGLRKALKGCRAANTPLPQWHDRAYCDAAARTVERFRRVLKSIHRFAGTEGGLRILDIGCGAGNQCLLMALRPVQQVVGIDLRTPLQKLDDDAPARRLADAVLRQAGFPEGVSAALRHPSVQLLEMDARRMAFADASFDLVLSRSAMEHIAPIEAALAEMARVVRAGGLVHHSIDPFFWLRGCHKRGLTDIPWAHARLSLDEYRRFVTEHEGPHKVAKRVERLQTLNRLSLGAWRELIESGPFEVLEWREQPSEIAETMLREHPDSMETLLPGLTPADLTCGRIDVWLRRRG